MSAMPDELRTVPLHRFLPPLNDREDRDEALMQRMSASIVKEGFLQPIRCVPETVDGQEMYRVVTGWTRVLCGRRAGKTSAPTIVIRRPLTETDDLVQKLTENDLRGATSIKDRIKWYFRLLQLNPDWSQGDLAKAVHSTPAEVSKTLRISKDLLPELLELVGEGPERLPVTAAYAIARVEPEQQRELTKLVLAGRLKRDAVELEVARRLGKRPKKERPVKVVMDAASVLFPGNWTWEKIAEFGKKIEEAAKRGAKMPDLPPAAVLQSILKRT